jgi:hypothetical protein
VEQEPTDSLKQVVHEAMMLYQPGTNSTTPPLPDSVKSIPIRAVGTAAISI